MRSSAIFMVVVAIRVVENKPTKQRPLDPRTPVQQNDMVDEATLLNMNKDLETHFRMILVAFSYSNGARNQILCDIVREARLSTWR